jgi:hypothetical protein
VREQDKVGLRFKMETVANRIRGRFLPETPDQLRPKSNLNRLCRMSDNCTTCPTPTSRRPSGGLGRTDPARDPCLGAFVHVPSPVGPAGTLAHEVSASNYASIPGVCTLVS